MQRRQNLDRTGPDRIGLFISVCGYYVIQHLIFGFRQKFKRDFQIFSGLSSICAAIKY